MVLWPRSVKHDQRASIGRSVWALVSDGIERRERAVRTNDPVGSLMDSPCGIIVLSLWFYCTEGRGTLTYLALQCIVLLCKTRHPSTRTSWPPPPRRSSWPFWPRRTATA